MRWAQVIKLLEGDVVLAVETSKSRTRCWIREGKSYTEIAPFQFRRLISEGYVHSNYEVEPNLMYRSELRIYKKTM